MANYTPTIPVQFLCGFSGRVAQMVERSLSMREVLGSMPRSSNSIIHVQDGELIFNNVHARSRDTRDTGYTTFIPLLIAQCPLNWVVSLE